MNGSGNPRVGQVALRGMPSGTVRGQGIHNSALKDYLMKVELRQLYIPSADEPPDPVVIEADTRDELEERLFDYLSSGQAQTVIAFDGDFAFKNSQRFMRWLAARPVVDVQDDEEFLESGFGSHDYRRPGWDEPYEPVVSIDRAVGQDTGHRISIYGAAHALVRRPADALLLFTPEASQVIVSEHWDNNGWGHATRTLAIRTDGLLEASYEHAEGTRNTYALLPPADTDEQLAEAVVRFNRTDTSGFVDNSIVEGRVFHARLNSYLLDSSSAPNDDVVQIEAHYALTSKQRTAARALLGSDLR